MTIRDVAKLAGVSPSTVSKVMNKNDRDVSPATKEKILQVVEQVNYVPYLKFRERENLKNNFLGLLLQKNNYERDNIAVYTEHIVRQLGYELIIRYVETPEEIPSGINGMIQKGVSGLIVDSENWTHDEILPSNIVFLNSPTISRTAPAANFYYTLSDAGECAVTRLVQEGHQKIACLVTAAQRDIVKGYKLAMQENHIAIKSTWTFEGESLKEVNDIGIRQCLDENITAVVCGSPEIAGCFSHLMKLVYAPISVISVGDQDILGSVGSGITAVKLPVNDVCVEAVSYLVHMLYGEKQREFTRHFHPSIVERSSIIKPTIMQGNKKIIVIGSMNKDITIKLPKIPVNGETQLAENIYEFSGGKGGNQAVGVSKLDGQAYIVGCLGNDLDGRQLYEDLLSHYVHMDAVMFSTSVNTGKAYIHVGELGESTIVVYPGANKSWDIQHFNRFRHLFRDAQYCLISLEIENELAEYAILYCKRNQTEVILKPSNTNVLSDSLLEGLAYLVPNEKELHYIMPGAESLEEKAEKLMLKGVQNVIVTLGEKGCYLRNKQLSQYFTGSDFKAVDTTGGADSFISALAVYLNEGYSLVHAIGFAVYASGITVTRYGVQPALPVRKSLDIYRDEIFMKYSDKMEGDAYEKHIGLGKP